MIPMLLKMKIPREDKNDLTIYLPLFIAWVILLPILILMIPLIIVISILTWATDFGRIVLFFIPMLFSLFWNLHGLTIDIEDRKNTIYLSFI